MDAVNNTKVNKLLIVFLILFTSICIVRGQQKNQDIKLDFFYGILSQIDGCSGLYTYDSASLKKKRYIVVTDLQDAAFIKVHGKQITLKRTVTKSLSKTTSQNIFKGNGYTVALTTKTIKRTGDEVWMESGTVEISKGKYKVKIKIHGESGC